MPCKPLPYLLILLALLLLIPLLRPRWYLNLTKQVEISPQVGAALVEKYKCRKCHPILPRCLFFMRRRFLLPK